MAYEYPIEASAMFEDRAVQMANFGVSRMDIDGLRRSIKDMWANAPGGWVYEWSKLGARYAAENQPYVPSVVYGWAKFPWLADEAKREALAHQIDQYIKASGTFDVRFERRVLTFLMLEKLLTLRCT